MEQKLSQDPNLSVEVLDQMMAAEFVDWFKKTVRTNSLSIFHILYTYDYNISTNYIKLFRF